MPARASVVKVLTPPDNKAGPVPPADSDSQKDEVSFDAFKAVPVSERRLSAQNMNAERGAPKPAPGPQPATTAVPSALPNTNGWPPAGAMMMNGGVYGPQRMPMAAQQPFLMQVPQGVNMRYAPQPQQPTQTRPTVSYNQNGNDQAPRGSFNNTTTGRLPSLPMVPRQNSWRPGTDAVVTPRSAPPASRPHATPQQQPVVLPDNDATFIPDPVEDANQRFKEAKQKSMRRKKEAKSSTRNNSMPTIRSAAVVGDNLNKRHSDPLPEITHFDEEDFGMLPMNGSAGRRTGQRRPSSPPPDAAEELANITTSAKPLQPTSSGDIGDSSLTRIPVSGTAADDEMSTSTRNRAAPQRSRSTASITSSSDSGSDSLNASGSRPYSFGSFGFGSQLDTLTSSSTKPRGTAMDVRSKKRPSAVNRRSLTSPVATLDYVATVDTSRGGGDSFSQRYFGFHEDDPLRSPLAGPSSSSSPHTARRNSTVAAGRRGSTSTARGSGPSGAGIYGTPLTDKDPALSFVDRKGSVANRSGTSFEYDGSSSAFGSAMLGSFSTHGSNATQRGGGSSSLYPNASARRLSPQGISTGNESTYASMGLDSFLLTR